MIPPEVEAFDAAMRARAPTVPWWEPLKVAAVPPLPPRAVMWRCRLCWVRVGVVEFPTRPACVRHLKTAHGGAGVV
jgi:hypothetical protein